MKEDLYKKPGNSSGQLCLCKHNNIAHLKTPSNWAVASTQRAKIPWSTMAGDFLGKIPDLRLED